MNYYEHHIRDYDAATNHLSWDEDMAYSRLIRWYYRKEKPIPADIKEACRQVRATSKTQREAVESVLREFFELREDGWHKDDCDALIAKFQAGEPEREQKKRNEDTRTARHRQERSDLFAIINAAGEHRPWNSPIADLRELAKRIQAVAPVTAPVTPDTLQVTATDTPVTATQAPIPNTQYPSTSIKNNISVENAAASNTAEGEKTPSVPLLHPFGLLLQTLEADRGCEFRTTGTAQVFADWSAKGITEAHVREAHATAVQRRQKAGNPSAVNVGLLDVILADLTRPAVSSVVPLPSQDPKERRHRELQAQYAGEVLTGPDGRRFEVMANGLVSVFVGADFQGTLGVDHARAFWDDVDAGVVVPRAA